MYQVGEEVSAGDDNERSEEGREGGVKETSGWEWRWAREIANEVRVW